MWVSLWEALNMRPQRSQFGIRLTDMMQINSLSNSYRSAAYREAAKWGKTPEIQNKAEKAAANAMTDSFVEQVKAQAKKDAKQGVYMSQTYIQMQKSHMNQFVSPDRSGPMAQVSNLIQEAMKSYDPILSLLDTMLGNYSVEGRISPEGQTAHIYSPDGEMIASYNSLGGGWTTCQTEAESKFLDKGMEVYKQAYNEARAELSAAGGQVQSNTTSISANVDIKV